MRKGSNLRRFFTRSGAVVLVAGPASLLLSAPAWAPPPPPSLPYPPAGVTATPGNGQAIVTWQSESPTCNIYFCPPSPAGYVARTAHHMVHYSCTAPGINSSACTITGLTNGVKYKVHASAYIIRANGELRPGGADPSVTVTPEP